MFGTAKGLIVNSLSVVCQCATEKVKRAKKINEMKGLKLQTKSYELLEKGYQDWLRNLGYNVQMVRAFPLQAREFLHWLESEKIKEIKLLDQKKAELFMTYFKGRSNLRLGGGLSRRWLE